MAIFIKLKTISYTPAKFLKPLLVMVLMACYSFSFAQSAAFTLTGVAYNKTGSERVGQVIVANLKTGLIAGGDDLGAFKINCTIGDTLLFKKKGYTDQKIQVLSTFVLVVYLHANVTLNEVEIRDITKRQELSEAMNDYNKKGVYNGGKASVLSNIFHPLNALFNIFGSDSKNARRFQRNADNELEQQAISRKFTVAQVQLATGLKDVKLKNFMDSYRPTYEECKNWNDYDAISYIKKAYEKFEKEGEPALPKLVP